MHFIQSRTEIYNVTREGGGLNRNTKQKQPLTANPNDAELLAKLEITTKTIDNPIRYTCTSH